MLINRVLLLRMLLAGLLAIAVAGCSNSSEITHSYVDPVLKKLDLDGVFVVGVAQKETARADFEDAFAKALSRRGVRAEASYKLVPGLKPDSEEIIAAAKKAGLDTILVTRYIGKSSEEVYHPGTIYYGVTPAYGAGYHGGFGGYYGHAYEVAYEQPVWTANVTHTLISDLYITASGEHMWQAVSDTIQASGDKKLRNDAIGGLIGNLKDQGLLD
ncbi:MAG: hypothetical protein V7754_07440 [Halioglobus sp.]